MNNRQSQEQYHRNEYHFKGIFLLLLMALALLAITGVVFANSRIATPEYPGPPFYSNRGPDTHDGDWVAIFFYRDLACIPADRNLLGGFDFNAYGCQLLVDGFAIFSEDSPAGPPIHQELHGQAVPWYFVSPADFALAAGDGVLTLPELEALPSLERGIARLFHETQLLGAAGAMINVVAQGTLEPGSHFESFQVHGITNQHSGTVNGNITLR